jgi:DNA repair protein RadD
LLHPRPPTKKMGLFRQMIGRVLRPAEGKPDAVILDHSGAVFRHGLPEDPVTWTLDPDRRAVAPKHQARLNRDAPKLLECSQCSALRLAGQPCPACGFLPKRPAQYVPHIDGDLALVNSAGRAQPQTYHYEDKRRWYADFTAIARERQKSPGWPFHLYLAKFKEKPPWDWRGIEAPPSPEVRAFVRSRVIAFAKARERDT